MNGNERRQEILRMLVSAQTPLSGAFLADHFSVSRQIIVQDIALIRADQYDIISTHRGYILHTPCKPTRVIKVFHTDKEMEDELHIIVDYGGIAEDVSVNHHVYGQLSAPLKITSRRDVQKFLLEIKNGKSFPLNTITSGYHYHTLSADSEETLDIIIHELNKKGYLCTKE